MFLTGHAASATVIARFVPNPILAFLLGVFSHVILDLIPHGDTEIVPEGITDYKRLSPEKKTKARRMFLAAGLADTTVTLFLFSGLFVNLPVNKFCYAFALLGALLIDLVDHSTTLLIPCLREKKWLLPRLHDQLHLFHKRFGIKDPMWRGMILQIVFIGVILFLNVYVWH